MFEYRDARGAIAIDFERGCVEYLESGGKILTAEKELPLFALRLRMPSCEAVHFDAFQGKLTTLSEKESRDFRLLRRRKLGRVAHVH